MLFRSVGLKSGERLLQPDDSETQVVLDVFATGGIGQRDWYLNGAFQGQSEQDTPFRLNFTQAGVYEIVVLDAQGGSDRVEVTLEPATRR